MKYEFKFLQLLPILIITLYSCYGLSKLKNENIENPYYEAYNFITNIGKSDSLNEIIDSSHINDFKNSVFFVYDSLVTVSTLNDSCIGINNNIEVIYCSFIQSICSNQYNIYDINQSKKVNWILYFSKIHDDYLVVDVIKISPLKFIWPDNLSNNQKELRYKEEALEHYKYNNLVNSYFLSIRYIFKFKINKKGKIVDVKYEFIQY